MSRIFRRLVVKDRDLMDVQSQIASTFNPLLKLSILDYVPIQDVKVTAAGVDVEHLLARKPLGWYVVDNTADARVWRTDWNERSITLRSSADTTISIIVF